MDIDEQKNQFEGVDHIPMKEILEKVISGASTSSEREENPGIRICDFCGKTFNGGKALGGHRRSHLIQTNKPKIKKHVSSSNRSYDLIDGKGRCCICNKDFPSMKSLFGHMRSHPDRDWRGIQPPPPPPPPPESDRNRINTTCSSTMSDSVIDQKLICLGSDSDIDLLKFLSNWSKTDRRGRRSIGGAAAAHSLVCLSRGKTSRLASIDDKNSVEKPNFKKLKVDKRGCLLRVRNKNIDEAAGNVDRKDRAGYEIGIKKMKKDKIWKKKLRGFSDSEPKENKKTQKVVGGDGYKCSSCDKCFPTFQALGGHRSSHNKAKKWQATDTSSICTSQIDETKERNGLLGGQIRLGEAPSSGEGSQSGPRILDFDLNEPYVMEDEGVESAFNQV